jgi:hypothetical protein
VKKFFYEIFSSSAGFVLAIVFIVFPFLFEDLQNRYGVNTAANCVWGLTALSIVVFLHCITSFDYWHAKERGIPGKVCYHAALTISSAAATVIGVGLLKGLLGSGYDLFILFSNSSVFLMLQTMTIILFLLHVVMMRISKEQANRFVLWYETKFKH